MKFVICISIVVFYLLFLLTGCSTQAERMAREQAEQERWNSLTVDEKLTEIRKQQEDMEHWQNMMMWGRMR